MSDLATPDDIALKLGRDLTDTERDQAAQTIIHITSVMALAAGMTYEQFALLAPRHAILRTLAIEKAAGATANNTGTSSTGGPVKSERLGEYAVSYGATDSQLTGVGGATVWLTKNEERLVRKAVHGTTFQAVPLTKQPHTIEGHIYYG